MNASPHLLLLASAGTGKTYRLTNHFLALLRRGVPPERILGTTFTRKAAGEILDRVLGRLAAAVTDPEALQQLSEAIQSDGEHLTEDDESLQGTPQGDLTHVECRNLLHGLVRRLDRFQICTLDAFFVRVAQLFAFDLGLSADWRILDDAEERELRDSSVARVLGEADRREWLTLLRALNRDEAVRPVARTVDYEVNNARHVHLEAEAHAWEVLQVPEGLSEAHMAEALRSLQEFECPRTKTNTPKKNWQKSLDQVADCVVQGRWKDFMKVGLVKKIVDDETHFDRVEIDPELVLAVRRLLIHVRHVCIAELDQRNRATQDLIQRFEGAFEQAKGQARGLRFEDLPQVLLKRGHDPLGERDDLWFRLDGRIDHLLLDEFQDTAPVQWRVLEPLADELLSNTGSDRSFFCVGDKKQSIYGWRLAEPRLLTDLAHDPRLRVEALNRSYRSAPVVLDSVHRVFANLRDCTALHGKESAQQAADRWQEGFERPLSAFEDMSGCALLLEACLAPASEEQEGVVPTRSSANKARVAAVLELCLDRVQTLHAQEPEAKIGVLLRGNKRIPEIIAGLARRGLRASGEGGNPLTDSKAVKLALSALRLADHPGDRMAAFHLATSAFGELLALDPELAGDRDAFRDSACSVSLQLRKRLLDGGLSGFLLSLESCLQAEEFGSWDRLRFRQLLDQACGFEPNFRLRTTPFVERIEQLKVETPAAASVQVMTVHMSKGLEFDAVILPELDADLVKHNEPAVVASRSEPSEPWCAASHSGDKFLRSLSTQVNELWDASRLSVYNDSFCILYVAMTRAERRLEMILQPEGSSSLSYAKILRTTLTETNGLDPNAAQALLGETTDSVAGPELESRARVLWAHPESSPNSWGHTHSDGEADSAAEERLESPLAAIQSLPRGTARELPTITPSVQQELAFVRGSGLFSSSSPEAQEARQRGQLLHRWFQEIEWLEDFHISDEELLQLGARIEPNPKLRQAALNAFRSVLVRPNLAEVLSRSSQVNRVQLIQSADPTTAPSRSTLASSGQGLLFGEPVGVQEAAQQLDQQTTGAVQEPMAVWPEFAFSEVLMDPDSESSQALCTGSMDRVVVYGDGQTVHSAEVLDFKTNTLETSAELTEATERYSAQMRTYQQVLAQVLKLPRHQIRARLVFCSLDEIVEV